MSNLAPSFRDRTTHFLHYRYGYPRPAPAASAPLLERLRREGVRMIALNRRDPDAGPWSGDCPRCGTFRGMNVEPNGHWWTVCACSPRGGDELELAMWLHSHVGDQVVSAMPEPLE
jgi:hypothetical protein